MRFAFFVTYIAGRWTNFRPSVTFDVAMHSLDPSPRRMIRVPLSTIEIQSFLIARAAKGDPEHGREKIFQLFTVSDVR